MVEGPTDDELRQQPEREQVYLKTMVFRHERAQAVLAEQQQARDLDQRVAAFQQAREQEAEEARKKQAAQEAEAGDGRNGDIGSAAARYSIAIGNHYDIRDPYASLARAAGAESAAFHKQQEQLKAEAAREADPDKRQAIELRRQIEGCEYMAITSDRLAGISVAVTGRDDNATAVTDRQQAAHWRAMAQGLREERSTVLEAVQAREAAPAAQLAGQVAHLTSADLRSRGAARPAARQEMPAAAPVPTAPAPEAQPAAPAQPRTERGAAPQAAPGAQPQAMPAPQRPDYRGVLTPTRTAAPTPAPPAQQPQQAQPVPFPAAALAATAARPAEPVRTPAQPQAAPQRALQGERPTDPAVLPPPTRPAHRQDLSSAGPAERPGPAPARPAELRVVGADGKDAGALSAFMQRETCPAPEPYRPASLHDRLNDSGLWKEAQRARFEEADRAQNAERALGRLGTALEKGRGVQAEDLRSLTREQWDSVRTKGEAGLVQSVREAKEHGAQDNGRGMGDGRTRRDW